MIRYIIALKRLAEPYARRTRPRKQGVTIRLWPQHLSRARVSTTLIPRISPLVEITSVRSRRRRLLPCNYSTSRAAATAGKRRAIVKILSAYRDSFRLLPPRDCSTPQSRGNYPAGWEMPAGDFTADRAARARLISRF